MGPEHRRPKSTRGKAKRAGHTQSKRTGERTPEIVRLRAAVQEKELLLREIHHRIKNNIQIISSLLRLEASRAGSEMPKEALRVCQSRIRSISLIHEKLYQSQDLAAVDFCDYTRTLAGELLHLYGIDESQIRLDVRSQGVRMPTKKAVSCGLIVSELVINALKHAFPAGRPGTISIEIAPQERGRTMLLVRDDGIGLPADYDAGIANRLGLRIVSDLVKQLDGEMHIDRSEGTAFRIIF